MDRVKKIKRFFKKIIKKADIYSNNNFYCPQRDYTKTDNIIYYFEINNQYNIKLTIDYTNLNNIIFKFEYNDIVDNFTKKYFLNRKIHLFNTIMDILNKIFNIFKLKRHYNHVFNSFFYKINDENHRTLLLEKIIFKNSKLNNHYFMNSPYF